jgi:hypothetical protein
MSWACHLGQSSPHLSGQIIIKFHYMVGRGVSAREFVYLLVPDHVKSQSPALYSRWRIGSMGFALVVKGLNQCLVMQTDVLSWQLNDTTSAEVAHDGTLLRFRDTRTCRYGRTCGDDGRGRRGGRPFLRMGIAYMINTVT